MLSYEYLFYVFNVLKCFLCFIYIFYGFYNYSFKDIYCIYGYFCLVLFSNFFICKCFCSVLNWLK